MGNLKEISLGNRENWKKNEKRQMFTLFKRTGLPFWQMWTFSLFDVFAKNCSRKCGYVVKCDIALGNKTSLEAKIRKHKTGSQKYKNHYCYNNFFF